MSRAAMVATAPGAVWQDRAERRGLGYWAFALQVWVLIFAQKLVVPLGPLPISLPFVALYLWLAFSMARGELRVSPIRLTLYFLMCVAALTTQILASAPISTPSLLQFLLLYLPLVFLLPVTFERYRRLLDLFQGAMTIGAFMVLLQLGWQLAFGLGNSPNLERYVPQTLLLQGYNYAAPIRWGEAFVRPNGFFFLEPSFVSSFLASALVIELMFFVRLRYLLLFGAALLATFAATGIVVMMAAGPFLLARQNLRTAALTAAAGAMGLMAALYVGVVDRFVGRLGELSTPGSSGFARLVQPLIQLGEVYARPETVFAGLGAGNSVEHDVSLWPAVKVAIEYGAVAAVLFMAFITVCMSGSRNRALAVALFVVFNFTGGFLLLPVTVIQIMLLVCLMPPLPGERRPFFGGRVDTPPPHAPEAGRMGPQLALNGRS